MISDTAQVILAWLQESAAPSIGRDIGEDTELIEQGVLDSLQILNLVGFMEERFAVTLPVEEFVPENFRTAATIAEMVERLCEGAAKRTALGG